MFLNGGFGQREREKEREWRAFYFELEGLIFNW